MSKGEETREMILERAAQLFSRQGYFGSSLADIMRETGLEKGGIYNHFSSKEELALEAFDYAMLLVQRRIQQAFEGKRNAIDRLMAYTTVMEGLAENSPVAGCPILNTSIEADDAHGPLRNRAQRAMDTLRETICHIITKGIERHEIRPGVDADAFASIFISTLEGAIMMSKLYRDTVHMQRAIEHIRQYIELTLRPQEEHTP